MDRVFPFKPAPSEVAIDCVLEFGTAPGGVDILHAQQQSSVHSVRTLLIEQGGIGVAQMQKAVGRWGEPESGAFKHSTSEPRRIAKAARLVLNVDTGRVDIMEPFRDVCFYQRAP